MANRVFYSLVFGFLAIGGLVIFQMTRSTAATVYLPSELATASSAGKDIARVRVAGRVTNDPISYQVEPSFELKFKIHDPGKDDAPELLTLPVVYNRIKPDMFASGRDVIIDGEFKGGTLLAYQLLTQCPSKYEAPDPNQKYQLNQ